MQPATIPCDNRRADSARCGETALVRSAQYVYERDVAERGGDADLSGALPKLREARYRIECPSCGERTQIERFE